MLVKFCIGCEIDSPQLWFRKAYEIHFSQSCSLSCSLYSFWHFASLWIFRKALRNYWMLNFFSDSLPCILDWFGKGYEALQNLDSSYVWASTCFAMDYTKFSLLLSSRLMIKKLSKTPKLAKKKLITNICKGL